MKSQYLWTAVAGSVTVFMFFIDWRVTLIMFTLHFIENILRAEFWK